MAWVSSAWHHLCQALETHIAAARGHQTLTLTYHCALLADQSKHVLSACLYRCIALCRCADSSDMLVAVCA